MIIGYTKTSTIDQIAGFEAQLRELEAVKSEKNFREQVSSVAVPAQLEATVYRILATSSRGTKS